MSWVDKVINKNFIQYFLLNTKTREYCQYLLDKYNETLEGKYRIKYNALYPILYSPISMNKKQELFKSFISSLDINPIEIVDEKIVFIKF